MSRLLLSQKCNLRAPVISNIIFKGEHRLRIRDAIEADFEQIWPIFHEIASAGETYAYPQDTSKDQARKL